MRPSIRRCILLTGLLAMFMTMGFSATPDEPARMKQFLYVLHLVPRLHAQTAWTDADNKAVADHFQRLKLATQARTVLLAGRTSEPLDQTFGIVIFEASDEASARKFMESDPTVAAGVMTATLHPFAVALLRAP